MIAELADDCARLWNTLNYRRTQVFSNGGFDWNWDSKDEYDAFKKLVVSATTQQMIQ